MSKMLDDLQRECSSLLEENSKLEEQKIRLEEELATEKNTVEQLQTKLQVDLNYSQAVSDFDLSLLISLLFCFLRKICLKVITGD